MIILGREPQDTNEKILRKPRSGDRNIAVIPAAHGTTDVCRPLRGLRFYMSSLPWGSRPRLNICRRSAARPHDSTAVDFVVRTSRPHDSTAVNEVQPGRPHHNIDSGFLEAFHRIDFGALKGRQ